MSAAADLLLKTTLWTTWTTTRTTKAGSVFSTPAARKPATMNGSIPFPYYMWYSTISMYPTLDPLPSPPTRPCMSRSPFVFRYYFILFRIYDFGYTWPLFFGYAFSDIQFSDMIYSFFGYVKHSFFRYPFSDMSNTVFQIFILFRICPS